MGGNHGSTCYLKYIHSSYVANNGCDFDVNTSLWGKTSYPSNDPFDRSFYVYWPDLVTIASFYIDSYADFVYCHIYVSDVFPFTRNDPNKLIWPNSMYPVGLYNLPIARQGKYLVFMPLDT